MILSIDKNRNRVLETECWIIRVGEAALRTSGDGRLWKRKHPLVWTQDPPECACFRIMVTNCSLGFVMPLALVLLLLLV